ncbi:hypothetical protein BD413DRAFT_525079 [Trametes elegans]|nr:hypothetical protein BD413DRAFT_525079 [Trametes elegans]
MQIFLVLHIRASHKSISSYGYFPCRCTLTSSWIRQSRVSRGLQEGFHGPAQAVSPGLTRRPETQTARAKGSRSSYSFLPPNQPCGELCRLRSLKSPRRSDSSSPYPPWAKRYPPRRSSSSQLCESDRNHPLYPAAAPMLSFVNSFRAVARRQPCRVPAARALSFHPTQTTVESMDEVSDYILDAAEQRDAGFSDTTDESYFKEGAEGESRSTCLSTYHIHDIDHCVVPGVNSRGFPALKGFEPDEFVQPRAFTRDVYLHKSKGSYRSKRPQLGPDAAESRYLDPFYQLNIDPLKECLNTTLLSHFVTSMGKIRSRSETNLTWKNQRRMGKAIRRAKMMGIIPVLSRRPLRVSGGR